MNRRACTELYSNSELTAYIAAQARRHFSCIQDQDDARQEAWERITQTPGRISRAELQRLAYRAIHAMYERQRAARQRETPGATCT